MKKTVDSYSYFSNRACRFFPCHPDADIDSFNCLFCYCPLYMLGEGCGGSFTYTEKGFKDCSSCLLPHNQEGYDYITSRFSQIVEAMGRRKQSLEGRQKPG
ncbi:Zn-finger protein [Desulfitobacterium sp. LBE]|uniref:cysteine-rich small domain-containing protein n=1 Tax=Desulfitobacterium sp. LBE TaxID=884086 RepID=UPI00119C45DD|nr:cysteine-rich small domain-containing protein [Desulfitobacterium sp. LBE]TWH57571.1 Zn-finger protein [Desulfitobacterium sp. LBE]